MCPKGLGSSSLPRGTSQNNDRKGRGGNKVSEQTALLAAADLLAARLRQAGTGLALSRNRDGEAPDVWVQPPSCPPTLDPVRDGLIKVKSDVSFNKENMLFFRTCSLPVSNGVDKSPQVV